MESTRPLIKRFILPLALLASIGLTTQTLAQSELDLGAAASFAVLGATTVTNTGPTTISGDLGLSPGTSVTGFPPGIVTDGTIQINTADAIQAQIDAEIAYNYLQAQPAGTIMSGIDLGGQILTPGTYTFAAAADLNGILTLDGNGEANPLFIFQIGSTLISGVGSSMVLINGAQASDIFFAVGSSATLGVDSTLSGNVIALTSITANTGADIDGRLLALNGAVTLDTNNIAVPVPEPSSAALVMAALAFYLNRRKRLLLPRLQA